MLLADSAAGLYGEAFGVASRGSEMKSALGGRIVVIKASRHTYRAYVREFRLHQIQASSFLERLVREEPSV